MKRGLLLGGVLAAQVASPPGRNGTARISHHKFTSRSLSIELTCRVTFPSACLFCLHLPAPATSTCMHARVGWARARTDRIGGEYVGGRPGTTVALPVCSTSDSVRAPGRRLLHADAHAHDHLATARVGVELTPSSLKKGAPSPDGHWAAAAGGRRRSRHQPTIVVAALTPILPY